MAPVRALAKKVRDERKAVAADNPFVAFQEQISRQIVASLDAAREMNESLAERIFLSIYGSPMLQAAVGVDPVATHPLRKAPHSPLHRQLLQARIAELKSHIAKGGVREGMIRALLYVGMNRAAVDERGFETVRRIRRCAARHAQPASIRVQVTGARTILHAADRPGGLPRSAAGPCATGLRYAAQNTRPYPRGVELTRPAQRRRRRKDAPSRSIVWSQRSSGRSEPASGHLAAS